LVATPIVIVIVIVIVAAVRADLRTARKLSGGEFSGPLFKRLKAVEQGRLGKRCRLEIGPRLAGRARFRACQAAGRRGPI